MIRPIVLACMAAFALPIAAAPLGTAFTYQGHLVEAGQPANGLYDFEFCFFGADSGGVGDCLPQLDSAEIPVENGVFSAKIDAGDSFSGNEVFLELRVRAGNSIGAFEVLSPRQLITPTPEALHARSAASVEDGSVGASQIDLSEVQARVSGVCAVGQVISAIQANGSVTCSPAGASPVPGILELDSAVEVEEMSIAVGPDGLPAISYFDADGGDLEFIKCSNSSCTGPVTRRTLDSVGVVGSQSSIAVRNDNVPVISYRDSGNNRVKLAVCTTVDCSSSIAITAIDNGTGAGGTSVALKSTGEPVVAYGFGNALRLAHCPNQLCIGSIEYSELDSGIGLANKQPSLALDSNDFAAVSYNDTASGSLKFARCTTEQCEAGEFSANTIDATNFAGGSSLAITSFLSFTNFPVISYRRTGELMFARCGQAACASSVVLTSLDTVPLNASIPNTSLAIGSGGNPVVGYTNGNSGDLKVAKCVNSACTGGTSVAAIRDTAFADSYVDMVVGADGLPTLVYKGFNKLRIAKCATSSCQ